MLFSANWLARYVDTPSSVEELGEVLTRCGMVVDASRSSGDDTVFDLDIPSNRVDAMNHFGVAREIATALRTSLGEPDTSAPEAATPIGDLTSVTIEDLEGCPRYAARLIRDVRVAPSPPWMVKLLEAIGLRPLNNVADITNFVLWELGHPLHAFDFDRLSGRRIVVRRAREGESLETLDGVERELATSDVIIADDARPVAVAGIMGGNDTAISDLSTNVLLEGAWFDPAAVRATAQRLNLHTDASHRFERTPARDGMLRALDRAATLIIELAGGELAAGTIDEKGPLPEPVATELRAARLAGILGIEVGAEDVEDILERLGFRVLAREGGFEVQVPTYRPDVTREEDLIEEVGRHVGYDRLPATLPVIPASEEAGTPEVLGEQRLKRRLSAAGCYEAMSSSLSSESEQRPFLDDTDELVRIGNPISEGFAVLRAHLIPGLLNAVAFNINHGQTDLRLFELGRRFGGPLTDDGITERWGLGIAMTGRRNRPHWSGQSSPLDFFDLKGTVEDVSRQMAWPRWHWAAGQRAGLDPAATALLHAGGDGSPAASGWAGRLDPAAAAAFGIEADVWVAELDIEELLAQPHPTARHQPISRFPGGTRDVALVLPQDVRFGDLRDTARATAADQGLPLATLTLVEVYVGEEIPPDARGLTLRFGFRADDRTLTADEIDAAQRALVGALTTAHDARQR